MDRVLSPLNLNFFSLDLKDGSTSIASDQLLPALLLQVISVILVASMLFEQLDDHLLFHSFAGLKPDDPIGYPSPVPKNLKRLVKEQLMLRSQDLMITSPETKLLISCGNLSGAGILLPAWDCRIWLNRIEVVTRFISAQCWYWLWECFVQDQEAPSDTLSACCFPSAPTILAATQCRGCSARPSAPWLCSALWATA